jgi:putative ATP-dependent endonuclease of OLD family
MRQLRGDVGTVVIEEPEMYLHPQAERYLYRLLTEMADRRDSQVVYASHSLVFADATRFDDIRLAHPSQAQRPR